MKPHRLWMYTILITLCGVANVLAQAQSEPRGRVHLPVSCRAAAQAQFDRAGALRPSFWSEEAVHAFAEVTKTDPHGAMGDWGIAMSLWYPLWYPPSQAALQQGAAAVEQAQATKAPTAREPVYSAAIAACYNDAATLDHRPRAVAYEAAMAQVHLCDPDAREAAVCYARALDATALPADKTDANHLKAAELLDQVVAEQPNHPGVAHDLIHCYDDPPLASRALTAARSSAQSAPSAPHALHRPSHIFTRLGRWQEASPSTGASAAARQEYARQEGAAGAWPEQRQAMDDLVYASVQGTQDRAATRVLDARRERQQAKPESVPAAYACAAIPARSAVERYRWNDAAALTRHPSSFPWSQCRWGEAMTVCARALGAARSGDGAKAGKAVATLQALPSALLEA